MSKPPPLHPYPIEKVRRLLDSGTASEGTLHLELERALARIERLEKEAIPPGWEG